MKKNDFVALEKALWAAMVRDTEGPPTDPAMMWQPAYIQAIEKAILMDDCSELVLLMKEKHPIHPMLLPALADAISARGQNKASGIKRSLTDTQMQNLARRVRHLRLQGKTNEEALEEAAYIFKVSDSTAKRAFQNFLPANLRIGHIRRRL